MDLSLLLYLRLLDTLISYLCKNKQNKTCQIFRSAIQRETLIKKFGFIHLFSVSVCQSKPFIFNMAAKVVSGTTFHVQRFGEAKETDDNEQDELLKKLKRKITKSKSDITEIEEDKSIKEVKDDDTQKSKSKKVKKRKIESTESVDLEESSGFTPLGEQEVTGKNKIRRVLPKWLANPDTVSVNLSDQQMLVDQMPGLHAGLVQKLKENQVTYFFPVQRQVIPHLLNRNKFFRPSDLCVSAPTGSGKTLAFVLPLVQLLSGRVVPRVRALVVLPVQDLATQVFKVFQAYAGNLRVKLISGQKTFAQEQVELVVHDECNGQDVYHSLADIVVATPGRLVDHIQVEILFRFEDLKYFVKLKG